MAIRVWQWPHWAMYQAGGITEPLSLGDLTLMEQSRRTAKLDIYWRASSDNVQLLIAVLAAGAVLGFFVLHPKDREYLWFGLYEIMTAARLGIEIASHFATFPLKSWEVISILISGAQSFFLLTFLWSILHQRRDWLFRVGAISLVIYACALLPGELEWISVSRFSMLLVISSMPFQAVILFTLFRASRHRRRQVTWITVPIAVSYLESLLSGAFWVYESAGHPGLRQRMHWFYELTRRPFPLSLDDLVEIGVQLALLGVLVVRFAQTRRDEQRFASELEAARAVQNVLLPEAVPAIPGLRIEAIYEPAGEVGGDFFQIVPLASGGALVAIGDVSGKGVPAALTVSLLVGMLRALARSTQSPGAILAEMNEGLVERGTSGFTTCLLCRLDEKGTVTVANAGHLAPYLQRHEVTLEISLPLGLTANTPYPESVFHLPQADQLTLLTDGVIEARSRSGELFGFERAASLTMQTARVIAHAAQGFGQEDDITVLTITRMPFPATAGYSHPESPDALAQ